MELKELFNSISAKLQKIADVKFVFGSLIETKNKSIIPVCRISYGFGAGAGEWPAIEQEEGKTDKPKGGGGGGGFQSQPLGVFEITENSTHFIPVIPIKAVLVLISIWIITGIFKK